MPQGDQIEKVESLKNILVTRATGGHSAENEYPALRAELVSDSRIGPLLPKFVRTCRTVDEFWNFIKGEFATYSQRREFLRNEFDPVLSLLENQSVQIQQGTFGDPGGSARLAVVAANPSSGNQLLVETRHMDKPFLSLTETKETLGLAEDEVDELVASRSLPEFREGPRRVFKRSDVELLRAGGSNPKQNPRAVDFVFIGHGHSLVWLELREFLEKRLKLKVDEFNREPTAGMPTTERLEQMLSTSAFALLVMTAEDERADGTIHARENVVHEVGLFQGRLGFHRAIILLEDGCQKFSNVAGLTYISFPKNDISAAFEKIRRVLGREKIIKDD